MVIRETYLKTIERFLDAPIIKILTGMRRVGKSTILLQMRDRLISGGVNPENIVFINMEIFENSTIKDAAALHATVTEQLSGKIGEKYILLDEVQEIDQWEKAVQSFLAENLGKIIITGSNAHMLSSELATLLTGRFIEIPVYPLSFCEFLDFRHLQEKTTDERTAFTDYLAYGGLPGIHALPLGSTTTTPYLNAVLDTLLLRDVVKRHNIRDVSTLERILFFAMDNVGSLVSVKSIADYFKSQGLRVSVETVSQYLRHLCDASILIRVSRFDIQGKRQLEYLDKYYLGDIGLRYAKMGNDSRRLPGTLENIVLHELFRRGFKVFVGAFASKEIDFIAEKDGTKQYFQVATYLTEQSTIEREFGNLEAINDHFPKTVLSLDELPPGGRNGIVWKHIREWLTE